MLWCVFVANPTVGHRMSILFLVKRWSDAVNAQIEDIVKGVPPFPLVHECLDKINQKADAMHHVLDWFRRGGSRRAE